MFKTLTPGETETLTLRRVLKEDYGTTSTATCASVLFVNNEELALQEERKVLDRLFASVPPLLMQHTLRLFVESDPRHRREYFERLLRLDELTNLIGKAVVGDDRLVVYLSPTGSVALQRWETLGSMVQAEPSKRAHRRASRSEEGDLTAQLREALTSIGYNEFSTLLDPAIQYEQIGAALTQEQRKVRQKSFPLLAQLRPQKQISDDPYQSPYAAEVTKISEDIREAWKVYEIAKEAAASIGSDRLAISHALKILVDANVVQRDLSTQVCPICGYERVDTLSIERIAAIEGWTPVREAEGSARQSLQRAMTSLLEVVKRAVQEHDELLPRDPSASDWAAALAEASAELQQAVQALRKVRENDTDLESTISVARDLTGTVPTVPTSHEICEGYITRCTETIKGMGNVPAAARRYRDAFRNVEAAVGAAASVDPQYRLREAWLTGSENVAGVAGDLRWEQAKRQAQKDLQGIRDALMDYRQQFLEVRRNSFNDGIQSVWTALRSDQYSSFSQLHIPPPRGRGFPVEIEVKAMLDDGTDQKEVDALKVFSESQVNALGIAAFITRSKLVGHRMLIFDDPVQSMDEDHFKTFARDVIPHVLGEDFQIILLTHNDTFARDVSLWHYDSHNYVTMSVRHSRREGCIVEEGNRRVAERLKLAETKAEEGNLAEAWRYVRLAIERLYTITYAKHGPPEFNPDSWQHQSAEYMWESGADNVITSKVPDSQAKLKEILNMTVAGGHDEPPRGETDLRDSIKYLRSLLGLLQIGG